jgi:hypothetical protein
LPRRKPAQKLKALIAFRGSKFAYLTLHHLTSHHFNFPSLFKVCASVNSQIEFEQDPKLPSGEWTGFFLEEHRTGRGWMHLYLNFSNGRIEGEGTDYVGPWHIRGSYDLQTSQCQWTKQYLGRHIVIYQGTMSNRGIMGQWEIQHVSTGIFHIWPKTMTEIQQLYLNEDLEERLPLNADLATSTFNLSPID